MILDPFPHLIIDAAFSNQSLEYVLLEFSKDLTLDEFDSPKEKKFSCNKYSQWGKQTKQVITYLNSKAFLKYLTAVTGIQDLIPDQYLVGAGLHKIVRGGKLAIHADFNKHPATGYTRRINVLIYLNKNWPAKYGGNLELWDKNMQRCVVSIAPLFNRMVIFETSETSYHGHPDPLTCPKGHSRKSIAMYYYTNSNLGENIPAHSTIFKKRPGEVFKFSFRSLAKRIVIRLKKIK